MMVLFRVTHRVTHTHIYTDILSRFIKMLRLYLSLRVITTINNTKTIHTRYIKQTSYNHDLGLYRIYIHLHALFIHCTAEERKDSLTLLVLHAGP